MKKKLFIWCAVLLLCAVAAIAVLGQANQNNFSGINGIIASLGNLFLNQSSGYTMATDINGGVWVDGTRFTGLCGALAYVNNNPTYSSGQTRARVYDFNKYEVWQTGLDPWNAASCGNGTIPSPSVYLGNGVFVNATGGTIHLPSGTELYMQGRAAETAINTNNGCQATVTVQCIGTMIIAYNTAAPFTGNNTMTCPAGGSCTVLPNSTPVIDYSSAGSFGTVIQGPGTISCAGITGSIGIQNAQAQEQSFLFHIAVVGCQQFAIDWNGANAQNSWIDDFEILSGNLTGSATGPGSPNAFIGMRVSINGPNRHYGNGTCNTRGVATLAPVTACILVINSRGGRIHDVHYENANYGVIVDGSSNVVLENINTAAVFQPGNIATIQSNGANTTTVTTTTPYNGVAGITVTIAGTSTALDGACTNLAIVNGTQFTCTQAIGAVGPLSIGTATMNGGQTIAKICSAGSTSPCTSGSSSTNTTIFGLGRISPNLTLDAIVDDTNSATDGTIVYSTWTGFYQQPSIAAGAVFFPLVVYNTGSGAQTGSVVATTMTTAGTGANTYVFSAFADVSAAGASCTTNTTVAVAVLFTDPSSGAQTTATIGTLTVVNNGAGGNNWNTQAPPPSSATFRAKASTTVQYQTTYTPGANCAPSPAVRVFPVLLKVN